MRERARSSTRIGAGGMLPRRRAEKVLRCAQIAACVADGDVYTALRELEPKRARTLLKRFPGVGDPGADKIMLLSGSGEEPALDSNGVRVVERLRGLPACSSYARSYRSAIESLRESGVRSAGRRPRGVPTAAAARPRTLQASEPSVPGMPAPRGMRVRAKTAEESGTEALTKR